LRTAVSEKDTRHLLETIMADVDAPSPSDDVRPRPSAQLHTIDRKRSSELIRVLSRTEVMIADFYKNEHLTQRLGQALVSIL
jgi:hypothetical protein